jgi:zinc D-Ala-D-Ala carboxypeptidase
VKKFLVGLLTGVALAVGALHAPEAVGAPPSGYVMRRMVVRVSDGMYLSPGAAEAWVVLKRDAAKQGVLIRESSALRTRDQQAVLYAKWVAGQGPRAAVPGKSKHEDGVAVDVQLTGQKRESPEYLWLRENAEGYGFKNTVSDEPWHWEFVGLTGSNEV